MTESMCLVHATAPDVCVPKTNVTVNVSLSWPWLAVCLPLTCTPLLVTVRNFPRFIMAERKRRQHALWRAMIVLLPLRGVRY